MRKLLLCLMVLSILSLSLINVKAEASSSDLQNLTIEELLALRAEINQLLQEKGYKVYFDISHGDKGENVSSLQKRLTELGYYSGAINGKYDSSTQKAVKQFQKDNNLPSNGTASIEMQTLLYSNNVVGKPTATPKPSPSPTPTIDPTFSEYGSFSYKEIARYPEQYNGTKVKLDGKVIQVIGTKDTGFTLRFATSGSSDIIYITVAKGLDFNILEDDRLTIYATLTGTKTYTSTFNQSITIPSAKADYVILR